MATTSALGVDDAFVELIYADEQLLRAEFDAVVAGEWPERPSGPVDHGPDAGRGPHRALPATPEAVPPRLPRTPARASRDLERQRSPPAYGR